MPPAQMVASGLIDVLAGVLGRAAAHGLEHGHALGIDVAAGCDAQAALNDGGQVGDDVAEQILRDDHVVVLGLLDEPHGAGVDVVVVLLDFRIVRVAHLLVHAHPEITAVGEHVALVHQGEHLLLAVAAPGVLVGVLHAMSGWKPWEGFHAFPRWYAPSRARRLPTRSNHRARSTA